MWTTVELLSWKYADRNADQRSAETFFFFLNSSTEKNVEHFFCWSVTMAHSRLKATLAFHGWELRFKPEWASIKWNPFPITGKVSIQTLGLSSEFVEALFISWNRPPHALKAARVLVWVALSLTSQRHGSGKVNNAASAVNSSISQDLRGLLMIASHWGGMCTQAANAFCGQDLDPWWVLFFPFIYI